MKQCKRENISISTVSENTCSERALKSENNEIFDTPLHGSEILDTLSTQPESILLNSYKFNKPRFYVKNDFPSENMPIKERLIEISLL